MSILRLPDSTTAAARSEQLIRAAYSELIDKAVGVLRERQAAIWSGSGGATPQQVYNQFGADAVEMRTAKNAIVTMITTMAAANGETIADYIAANEYTAPAGVTVTSNVDGTVTVT